MGRGFEIHRGEQRCVPTHGWEGEMFSEGGRDASRKVRDGAAEAGEDAVEGLERIARW